MKKPLHFEIGLLLGLSLLLAVGNKLWLDLPNNGRSASKIPWVRHWTPYNQLLPNAGEPEQAKVAVESPAPVAEASSQAAPLSAEEEAAKQQGVIDRITSNEGIADIGLAEAYELFKYGQDLTLWIDARDETLFQAGHIEGAQLLNFYNQAQYIEGIRQLISDKAPEALVLYCKGKDCTDSHHLAEDLKNSEGYPNIFVYTDGYDDWHAAGYPVEGTDAKSDGPSAMATGPLDPALQASVPELVFSNEGIREIGLEEAYQIYRYAPDLTFWIDAREPDLYNAGHIPSAHLLHYYNQGAYLDAIKEQLAQSSAEALVVYCKGKECTDSHHLAEELLGQDLGGKTFTNIFVYKDGFDDWLAAGYPTLPPPAAVPDTQATAPPENKGGMYLEHIIRDLAPFGFGLLLLLGWKRVSTHRGWLKSAAVVVGLFFIWAALPKILNPLEFAKSIWNYDIAPGEVINFSALLLPAVELLAGIGLVLGLWRRGSAALVSALLVIFIVAISYNVFRGHEFNCGCTSTATYLSDLYLVGWNDKFLLILRDLGLLVMGILSLRVVKEN